MERKRASLEFFQRPFQARLGDKEARVNKSGSELATPQKNLQTFPSQWISGETKIKKLFSLNKQTINTIEKENKSNTFFVLLDGTRTGDNW